MYATAQRLIMLFPKTERDIRIATRGMSHFEFLSRCSRKECAAVRGLLEDWYSNYPEDEAQELKARFASDDDNNFSSAFWELYLYELLTGLGYTVEIHPDLPTGETTQPDFLAISPGGDEVIIEAVSPAKQSEEDQATENRKDTVLDTVDKLDHPDFFVWLSEEGSPTKSPSGRRIREALMEWLDERDYNACQTLVNEGQFAKLPIRTFEEDGWKLKFRAFPKPAECRGKPSDRLIHLHSGQIQWVDSRTPIRDAIRGKASRYGKIENPYIVAVNARADFINDIDILEALFGKEVIEYPVGAGLGMPSRLTRKPDGVWTSRRGERNTRISAVLMGCKLFPSNVATKPLALYYNPWAKRPYTGLLTTLKQFVPSRGMLEEVDGLHPRQVFGLGENWPQSAA